MLLPFCRSGEGIITTNIEPNATTGRTAMKCAKHAGRQDQHEVRRRNTSYKILLLKDCYAPGPGRLGRR